MKKFWSFYIGSLFFSSRFYGAIIACSTFFIIRFFLPWLGVLPYLALLVFVIVLAADYLFLFALRKGVVARRSHAERFSNGDENPIRLALHSRYSIAINAEVIDEIPHQFQRRDVLFKARVEPGSDVVIDYSLRPVKRGLYNFGSLHVYVSGFFGLVSRRYSFTQAADVPVYPSYIQMRKYQLMAISHRLSEVGVKKFEGWATVWSLNK